MSYKTIANTIPLFMSAGLVGSNVREIKKKKPNMLKLGINNIVGASMIQSTAQITGGL